MRRLLTLCALSVALLVSAAPASARDALPCGRPGPASWSPKPVQPCQLSGPLARGRIPVYAAPVAHARGAALPRPAGYLRSVSGESFICQRSVPSAEYYHPKGYRNHWWAYTKSDDHHWGWTPEVFFAGGSNDEADAGLRHCGTSDPAAPRPPPPAPRCPDYSILGLRGSGRSLSGPYLMGSTVGDTAETAVIVLRHDKPGVRVSAYSIPYPAAPVSALLKSGKSGFWYSIHRGTALLESRIRSTVAHCPHTRIGVIGYSQGAGAASNAMRGLPAAVLKHVRATTLYADTYSAGSTSYAMTFDAFDNTAKPKRSGHGIFGKRRLPAALPHPLDVCFTEDLVCALTKSTGGKIGQFFLRSVHSHYVDYGTSFAPLTYFVGLITAREMER